MRSAGSAFRGQYVLIPGVDLLTPELLILTFPAFSAPLYQTTENKMENILKENEFDSILQRINGHENLPQEEKIEKYREEVRHLEKLIYTGSRGNLCSYLNLRAYTLNKLFSIHCTDGEASLFEERENHLRKLTQIMIESTQLATQRILNEGYGPINRNPEVSGYIDFPSEDLIVPTLADDDFYGSNFARMIPIITRMESISDMPIIDCRPEWNGSKYLFTTIDDGETWAEGPLLHPKLDHINMCYATHVLLIHCNYSIPDYLRMSQYKIKVDLPFVAQSANRL